MSVARQGLGKEAEGHASWTIAGVTVCTDDENVGSNSSGSAYGCRRTVQKGDGIGRVGSEGRGRVLMARERPSQRDSKLRHNTTLPTARCHDGELTLLASCWVRP